MRASPLLLLLLLGLWLGSASPSPSADPQATHRGELGGDLGGVLGGGEFGLNSKALFTLGALAVLGGASFYLGKQTGLHQGRQQFGVPPVVGYELNPLGPHNLYDPYSQYNPYTTYAPYSAYTGDYYPSPYLAYAGRRRRRDTDSKTRLSDDSSTATTSSNDRTDDQTTNSAVDEVRLRLDDQPGTTPEKSVPGLVPVPIPGLVLDAQRIDYDGQTQSHAGVVLTPELPIGLVLPKELLEPTLKKKEILVKKAKKFVPTDGSIGISISVRKRRASLKDRVVTSSIINVAGDPMLDYKTISSQSEPHRFPANTQHNELLSEEEEEHQHRVYPPPPTPRPSFRSYLGGSRGSPYEPSISDDPRRRRPDCVEPEGRDFEHFGLLMLESALSEDDGSCGLRLVCEIGRTPLVALTPKALGLRNVLTGPKPRGLDGRLWGALTQSLLAGLAGGGCLTRYPHCPASPGDLMRVFAQL